MNGGGQGWESRKCLQERPSQCSIPSANTGSDLWQVVTSSDALVSASGFPFGM